MFSPIRRSILYFASARFVIAIPLRSVQVLRGTRPPLRSKERRQAFSRARLESRGGVKQQASSRLPESAPEAAAHKWLRLDCQTLSQTAGAAVVSNCSKGNTRR